MILKTIYLYIGETGLPKEFTYAFLKHSRFICNWLEREIFGAIRFEASGFKRIVITLCSNPRSAPFINSSNVACVELKFDRGLIDTLAGDDLAKYQIDLLRSGIERCSLVFSIPKTELLHGLDLFINGGMKNEWLHKRITFKEYQLSAVLTCKLTQNLFALCLTVLHRKIITFKEIILETEPDEIVFERKFKDIEITNGSLVVKAKYGEILKDLPLSRLIK